jgi:hypothetical protein
MEELIPTQEEETAVPDFLQPLEPESNQPQAQAATPDFLQPVGEEPPAQGQPVAAPTGPVATAPTRAAPEMTDRGPNLSMYDSIKPGPNAMNEAWELYRSYAESPEASTNAAGITTYKGKLLPIPTRNLFGGGVSAPVSDMIGGAAFNAAKNVTQTAAAVGDFIESKVGGFQLWDKDGKWNPKLNSAEETRASQKDGKSMTASVEKALPEMDAGDKLTKKIGLGGTELVAGGLGGLGAANKLINSAKVIGNSRFLSGLTKLLGFELGAATTISSDSDTLVVGENALFKGAQETFPLFQGIPPGTSDTDAEKILKNRMNILTDAAMLAKPAEAVVKGAVWTGRLLWSVSVAPFLNVGSRSAQEKAIANEVLTNLANVGARGDEASLQAKERIVELIRNNSEVFMKTDDALLKDIDMSVDTITALERALKNNDTAEARQLIAKARSMRSGALNSAGGSPQLADTLGAPARALEDVTTSIDTKLGGDTAIEQSRQGLVGSGRAEIKAADDLVADLDLRLQKAEGDMERLIKEDPTFGARIDQLSKTSGVNIYSGRNQASDEIVANVRRAFEVMDAEKNRLYGAIEGGQVDPQGLLSTLNNLRPGQLDAAAGAMPANSQFGDLLNAARRGTVKEADEAGNMIAREETDDELLTRFTGWMESNGLDFGKLYRDIRPSVSQTAESLFKSASPEAQGAARTLREFSNWIDTRAVDDLIASGDEAVADAAAQAKDYYVKQYAPYWKDGVLKDVADLHRQTVGRTSESMASQGQQIRPLDFQLGTRQAVEGALTDTNREYANQVVSLLSRPEGGANPALVTDFILGDVLGDIGTKLRAGTPLSELDVTSVVSRLNEYGAVVSQNFPDQAARIGQFIDNIRNAKGDIALIKSQVDEATKVAAQARDQIQNNELSAFFKGQGIENPNGYAVFESILNGKQSENVISGLLQRADESGNPIIREGMQAAYARALQKRFLGSTEELGGNRVFKVAPESAETTGTANFLAYGDQIFSNRPEIMEATRELLDIAGVVTRGKGAKSVASDSPTAARTEAIAATNRLVTTIVGTLNRTGARIRSLATTTINRLSPDQAAFRILDAMYADPKYFTEIADKVIASERGISPEARDAMFAFLVRAGIYNETDKQDYVMGLADAELEARGMKESVDKQMEKAFQ